MPHARAHEVATRLASGRWTHDHALTVGDARELGLNVSTDMPPDILHLMTLYPQPMQRTPSVEYLPTRHRRTGADRPGGQ